MTTRSTRTQLSVREMDVLRLAAKGLSNTEIGHMLFISHRTVATHISKILEKLDVRNRVEAVAEALRLEILKKDELCVQSSARHS